MLRLLSHGRGLGVRSLVLARSPRHQGREASSDSSVVQEQASTVVIGGGVVGCSIAYHLAKAGRKDVVLLEKSELTAGSTWHAAGLTTYYHPGVNLKKIHYYSMELYKTLEKETGQAVGLHTCGSLRIAATPERADEFRYQMTRGHWHPNPQKLLTPEEVHEVHPLLNMDTILLGLYNPGDGHVDPYSLTQAFSAGAKMYGAKVVQGVEVTGTHQKSDGGWTVDTNQGAIQADTVVNAAGLWARQVGLLAGVDLPCNPIEHTYLISSSVPEVQALKKEVPVLRDLEGSYYLRQERDGLLFGIYESQESMKVCTEWYPEGPPKGFGMELFEGDLERLSSNISIAMDMVPCLQNAEIIRTVCGPITYSPDVLGLVGPYYGLQNYWTAVGFGYGIIHAGGVGKYMADWMLSGEPPYDLIELEPNRYGDWADRDYLFAKTRESYGMNTHLGVPKEEREGGRPTKRKSDLYEKLNKKGAVMGFHSGWEQPNWFTTPDDPAPYQPSFQRTNWFEPVKKECEMVMTKAGVIDLTPFGKFEIKGSDSRKFVDYVYANKLPMVGKTCIAHLLSQKGRVYAEHTVTCMAEQHFLCVTGSGSEYHDLRWLDDHAREGGYDVTINNITDQLGCIGLAGPLSRQILAELTTTDLSAKQYPFLATRKINVADVNVTATRISYTGELGWELLVERGSVEKVYDAIMAVAQPLGGGDFGTYAMNSLRLEKGFRGWGAEMNMDKNPVEAGLMNFVAMKKGEFIGREAVSGISHSSQVLRMLKLEEPVVMDPEGNETVWLGDKVVGNTTSGAFSVTLGCPLAFAYIPTEMSEAGREYQVELLGQKYNAIVLEKPPLLPQPARKAKK